MDLLKSISPGQLLLISIVITLLLIAELDTAELGVLSNVLAGIGGLIAIFVSQSDFIKGKNDELVRTDLYNRQIALLEESRDALKKCR
jgi:hypothetical protein